MYVRTVHLFSAQINPDPEHLLLTTYNTPTLFESADLSPLCVYHGSVIPLLLGGRLKKRGKKKKRNRQLEYDME